MDRYNLLDDWIVGIIDSYGAVHSVVVKLDNASYKTHEAMFPNRCFYRWRWSFNDGLRPSAISSKFDVEEWDKVRRHLTRKYGIKWWDNGYHDIDFIVNKYEKARQDAEQ